MVLEDISAGVMFALRWCDEGAVAEDGSVVVAVRDDDPLLDFCLDTMALNCFMEVLILRWSWRDILVPNLISVSLYASWAGRGPQQSDFQSTVHSLGLLLKSFVKGFRWIVTLGDVVW